MKSLLLIVEGHSEVRSAPILVRRLLDKRGIWLELPKPFRLPRGQMLRSEGDLDRAVRFGTRSRENVGCLLLLLDSDDDDPLALEADLTEKLRRITDLPVAVVAAEREFEGWFLGAKESLRGVRNIRDSAQTVMEAEQIRGAKERLTRNMDGDLRYLEVDDQPAMAAKMDLDLASRNCASFRRMEARLSELIEAVGLEEP